MTERDQQPVTVVLSVAELRCIADALTLMRGPAEVYHRVLDPLRTHIIEVLAEHG